MSERMPSLNRPCPCGSGKKFKRCCSWKCQDTAYEKSVPYPEFQQPYLDHQAHKEQLSLAESMRALDEAKELKEALVAHDEVCVPVDCCCPQGEVTLTISGVCPLFNCDYVCPCCGGGALDCTCACGCVATCTCCHNPIADCSCHLGDGNDIGCCC